jgi:glycosyltransferase involved in cell wall biosynthesis
MGTKLDCSVVVCTRNRATQLGETLWSFTKLNISEETTWEVVVVDNGSTDSTAEVVRSFENSLPIRRVFQPEPGISKSRNSGIDAAKGDYIVWTDDDVHVEPNWLAAFLDAFKRWPQASVFGGKITPFFVPPTPAWLLGAREKLKDVFAVRDFGSDPVPLSVSDDRIPFGACYAIRATEQRQYRYDPTLGRAPGQIRAGEETAVIDSILKANHSGWWIPKAEVKHIIPASRQTLEYVAQYYEGRGDEWAHAHLGQIVGWGFLGVPLRLWMKLPISIFRFRLAYMAGSKSWPHYFGRLAWYRGVFKNRLLPLEQWIAHR